MRNYHRGARRRVATPRWSRKIPTGNLALVLKQVPGFGVLSTCSRLNGMSRFEFLSAGEVEEEVRMKF
jgi:hypothetical protein